MTDDRAAGTPRRRRVGQPSGSSQARAGLVLATPVILIAALALNDGGFNLVARQEIWLVVLWLVALGLILGVLPRASPRPILGVAAVGFGILLALQFASAATGPSPDLALADAATTAGYFGILALAGVSLGPRSWRFAALGLLVAAVAVSAVALIGRLAPSLSLAGDVGQSLDSERLFAPLGYWNSLAAWAAATLAMTLAWSADSRRARVRALTLSFVPIAGTVLYLTYSRGGFLAAIVACGAVLSLTRNRPRALLHAVAGTIASAFVIFAVRAEPGIANGSGGDGGLTVGISLLVAVGACWALATSALSKERRQRIPGASRDARRVLIGALSITAVAIIAAVAAGETGSDTGSLESVEPSSRLVSAGGNRAVLWETALDGFAKKPLFGGGSGSFAYLWAQTTDGPELVRDAHSLPLEVMAELGLAGLLGLALAVGGLVSMAYRGFAAAGGRAEAVALFAALLAFLVSSMIDWTWDTTPLACLGVGSAGVLSMAASRPRASRRGEGRGSIGLPSRVRWGLVAVLVVLGAVQVPGAASTQLSRMADGELARGDVSDALTFADRAVTAAPWSGRAHAILGRARLKLGDLEAARAATIDAIQLEPDEVGHRLLLAQVEAAAGRFPEAAASFRAAALLSPFDLRLRSPSSRDLLRVLAREGLSLEEVLTDPHGG